ncbi:hypothetical protein Tco_0558719 [Tanacetum coccineum]
MDFSTTTKLSHELLSFLLVPCVSDILSFEIINLSSSWGCSICPDIFLSPVLLLVMIVVSVVVIVVVVVIVAVVVVVVVMVIVIVVSLVVFPIPFIDFTPFLAGATLNCLLDQFTSHDLIARARSQALRSEFPFDLQETHEYTFQSSSFSKAQFMTHQGQFVETIVVSFNIISFQSQSPKLLFRSCDIMYAGQYSVVIIAFSCFQGSD